MIGERIKKFAKILVDYCLKLKKDEKVLITGTDLATPLILEVYKNALLKGAYPAVDIMIPGVKEIYYKFATQEQLEHASDYARFMVSYFDAYLHILGGYNTKSMSGIPSKKIAMHTKANAEISNIQRQRMKENKLKWCATQFPTHSNAQCAGMSLFDYKEFIFQACFLNDDDPINSWTKYSVWQNKICKFLEKKKEFRIYAEDTELTLRTEGRTWVNCDGTLNFPDGEVFTGPIENSVNGHIKFSFPGIFQGKEIEDIRLTFENGKVVKAHAKRGDKLLQAMLNTDEGARYVGEFAIGTNFGIDRFTKNMLFDEKIGGTIHLAIGASIPQSGGINQSTIHWDMLCDMKDGEIYADDELIYKNRDFVIKFD